MLTTKLPHSKQSWP